jgi:hypothetical protein
MLPNPDKISQNERIEQQTMCVDDRAHVAKRAQRVPTRAYDLTRRFRRPYLGASAPLTPRIVIATRVRAAQLSRTARACRLDCVVASLVYCGEPQDGLLVLAGEPLLVCPRWV